MICETCWAAGEIYAHADDCDNDSCALAGGLYDCLGKIEPCPVCSDDYALAQVGTHPKGGDSLEAPAPLSDAVAEGHAPLPLSQSITPPEVGGELVERVARALYACEKARSDRCDAVISAAKGKTITVGMEPWEDCWQSFHDDARAAIATLSTPEVVDGTAGLVEALEKIERWFGEFPETGRFWDEPESNEPMSYSACFGSNGERDFMREIARTALSQHRGVS